MNRRNLLKAAAAGLAAAPLAVTSTSAQAATSLRMQTYWGKEANDIFKSFTDDVKTASKKSLRIRRYTGSSLVPDAEMFQAVGKGTIDMCQGYAGYWPGQLDIASIEAGLPGAWTNYDEAMYIMETKGLIDLIREGYAEQNVHYLGPIMGGPFDLLTKKPVNSLDDLKKMKIRATPSVAKILDQFGIPTVFLPGSELYIGLSTGAIDGVIYAGTNEYMSMKLYEAAKHYTSLNMVSPGYTDQMLINMDKWKAMTDDQRAIIETSFAKHASKMHTWMVSGSIDAGNSGLFELNSLSAEDSARLRNAAKVIWAEEAAKSDRNKKAIGILEAAAKATGRA
ncbi:TRAP transporter substrate-binding protein DctP [Marinobacterium jannaschii]|uniref:TRAP transporter substrate-binding protein DctP n=1 Tax=Marinobacterium jannaschii TaxID=64970 RepID=UPI0004808BFF|nr:TRAP transporter substrate-binding protein DctP [Marinobacterium jannaschii]